MSILDSGTCPLLITPSLPFNLNSNDVLLVDWKTISPLSTGVMVVPIQGVNQKLQFTSSL